MPPPVPAERQRYSTGFASQDAGPSSVARDATPQQGATAQAAGSRQQAPIVEPSRNDATAARGGLPQVGRFELPVGELAQVAQVSGLHWVNSDADKIAAVQAAIAAEPMPIRMPRERAPAVVVPEGALVLVETKRDLREMKLPFEQNGEAAPPQ